MVALKTSCLFNFTLRLIYFTSINGLLGEGRGIIVKIKKTNMVTHGPDILITSRQVKSFN